VRGRDRDRVRDGNGAKSERPISSAERADLCLPPVFGEGGGGEVVCTTDVFDTYPVLPM
jgi:hypothetical protein